MKHLLLLLALSFMMCCKKTDNNSLDAELAKLPPITQTGANTFGCLVNGKAVLASGCISCPKPVEIYYDTFSNGNINFYFDYNQGINTLMIGLDSIFTHKYYRLSGFGYDLKNVRLSFMDRYATDECQYISNWGFSSGFPPFKINGEVILTRVDTSNKIFSGLFNFNFNPTLCSALNFSNGRFDYKLK